MLYDAHNAGGLSCEVASLYGMPHIGASYHGKRWGVDDGAACAICGSPYPTAHHEPPRHWGRVLTLRTPIGTFALTPALIALCGSGTTGCHGKRTEGRIRFRWVWDDEEAEGRWWSGEMLAKELDEHSPRLFRYGHYVVEDGKGGRLEIRAARADGPRPVGIGDGEAWRRWASEHDLDVERRSGVGDYVVADKATMEAVGRYATAGEAAEAAGVSEAEALAMARNGSLGRGMLIVRLASEFDQEESFDGKNNRPVLATAPDGRRRVFANAEDAASCLYQSASHVRNAIRLGTALGSGIRLEHAR